MMLKQIRVLAPRDIQNLTPVKRESTLRTPRLAQPPQVVAAQRTLNSVLDRFPVRPRRLRNLAHAAIVRAIRPKLIPRRHLDDQIHLRRVTSLGGGLEG